MVVSSFASDALISAMRIVEEITKKIKNMHLLMLQVHEFLGVLDGSNSPFMISSGELSCAELIYSSWRV
jgi:hypothetical protein